MFGDPRSPYRRSPAILSQEIFQYPSIQCFGLPPPYPRFYCLVVPGLRPLNAEIIFCSDLLAHGRDTLSMRKPFRVVRTMVTVAACAPRVGRGPRRTGFHDRASDARSDLRAHDPAADHRVWRRGLVRTRNPIPPRRWLPSIAVSEAASILRPHALVLALAS